LFIAQHYLYKYLLCTGGVARQPTPDPTHKTRGRMNPAPPHTCRNSSQTLVQHSSPHFPVPRMPEKLFWPRIGYVSGSVSAPEWPPRGPSDQVRVSSPRRERKLVRSCRRTAHSPLPNAAYFSNLLQAASSSNASVLAPRGRSSAKVCVSVVIVRRGQGGNRHIEMISLAIHGVLSSGYGEEERCPALTFALSRAQM